MLADDDALLRAGVTVVLSQQPDVEVVGEVADGLAAVEACQRLAPDVVLMDVRMPGIDGIEATRRIVAVGSPAKVLVLTTFRNDDYVWEALRAGASGFLLKRASPERLVEAVRTVAAGDSLVDPAVTRALIGRFVAGATPSVPSGPVDGLTERETQVWRLIADGLSNDEIAHALGIAASTAKTHVKHVLAKTGARDRAQAVVLAYRRGVAVPQAGSGPV
nr:response regulator transcription factor [Modestobacter marinus]